MPLENITMPQLGESVTEGTITVWLKKVGDLVEKYEPIAEIQTDKVTAEVPSSFSGEIIEIVANEGDTIDVGSLMCVVKTSEQIESVVEVEVKQVIENRSISDEADISQKHRYSPAVLRLAGEHNIDLNKVLGSGKGGRITRKDIEQIVTTGEYNKKRDSQNKQEDDSKVETVEFNKTESGDIEVPLTPVRKTIAQNMLKSKHEIPHAWMMVEVDVTNLVSYRDSIKDEFKEKEGYSLTYFAFFVKAVAQALKEFPMMNSVWAGDKIIQKKDINISIAVATESALFVPVIKHADDKSIKGIAKEIHDLALKVRGGKLKSGDIQGGTFTVNNTGSFGSVQSMGIINYPQAAILQVESIVKRPVYISEGTFGFRDMVNLCLSLDHRVLDGLICGQFLNKIKETLENINNETKIY